MDDCFVNSKYDENINDKIELAEKIMAEGGFPFKGWIRNGDKGHKEIGNVLSRALGVYWNTEEDKIVFKVRINFSKKVRNRRLKPDSSQNLFQSIFQRSLLKELL